LRAVAGQGRVVQNLHSQSAEFVERLDGVGNTPTEMKKKTLLSWSLVLAGLSTAPAYGSRRPPSSTPPPVVVTTTVDRPVISPL
jgi:hypothetical protein